MVVYRDQIANKANGTAVHNNESTKLVNGTKSNTTSMNGKAGGNHNVGDKEGNRTVYIVFLSLILDLLAFTMILPLMPSLLESYSKNDSSGLYNKFASSVAYFRGIFNIPSTYDSVLFGGFLGSMFSFLQFIISPIMGGLSDVYGRKPLLIICLIGITASYGIWAISSNFLIFVIARFLGGLSKGNISLCMTIISDSTDEKKRNKAMALVGIAFSIAFILGPLIGAMFSKYSDKTSAYWWWLPATFAMGLSLMDLVFVMGYLKETLPEKKRSKHLINSLSRVIDHISLFALFRFRAVKGLKLKQHNFLQRIGLIYFLYLFIYSGLEFTVTFLMFHKFNFTAMDQAKMFLTTGIIMTLLQGSVVRRIPSNYTKLSAVFGLYLIIPAFIMIGVADRVSILYGGMILFAISTAFVVTCMTSLASKHGDDNQKGTMLGIFRSLGALARAIGPVVASTMFWMTGSMITYILGGAALLIPTIMLQVLQD